MDPVDALLALETDVYLIIGHVEYITILENYGHNEH